MTSRKLAAKSGVSYSVVYDMIPDLVKYGSLRQLSVAKRKHRQDFAYSLTDDGLSLALSIAYEDRVLGISYPTLLQRVFQTSPKDDPLAILVNDVMLNAVDRGMTEYVLRFLLAAMKEAEGSGGAEWKKAGLGAVEVLFEEEKAVKQCYLSALASLTTEDRRVVYQYYKGEMERLMFRLASRLKSRELMLVAAESQRDPDNLIAPFACKKCGFKDWRNTTSMERVMQDAFTKSYPECPRCGRPVKSNKFSREANLGLVASLLR